MRSSTPCGVRLPPGRFAWLRRGCSGAFRSEEVAGGWLGDGVQGERRAGFVAAWSAENHPAFEAGVKPAGIARQFRLSRAQVDRCIGAAQRSARQPARRARRCDPNEDSRSEPPDARPLFAPLRVAQRDPKHPLAQHVHKPVPHLAALAIVRQTSSHRRRQIKPAIRPAQQHHPAVARHIAAVKNAPRPGAHH